MKTIWITGGSSGIGFATAKIFLKNNWRVIISSSNFDKLQNASKRLRKKKNYQYLHIIKCDISIKNEVKNTIRKIEKGDKLFINVSPASMLLI